MAQRAERRPFLAATLSVIQPGLGHLYLRQWFRAALWASLWFGSLGVILATLGLELTVLETAAAMTGVFALVEGFPAEAVVSMLTVVAFGAMDAYWLAARNNSRLSREVGRCPHCGKELDPSLEFCHWCTTSLDGEEST